MSRRPEVIFPQPPTISDDLVQVLWLASNYDTAADLHRYLEENRLRSNILLQDLHRLLEYTNQLLSIPDSFRPHYSVELLQHLIRMIDSRVVTYFDSMLLLTRYEYGNYGQLRSLILTDELTRDDLLEIKKLAEKNKQKAQNFVENEEHFIDILIRILDEELVKLASANMN